jgi:hypothetical protein
MFFIYSSKLAVEFIQDFFYFFLMHFYHIDRIIIKINSHFGMQ